MNSISIMGILNVTPDSFSDGGRFVEPALAIDHALQMIDEGATIIDIGGESTRPGSVAVSIFDELERVLPVVRELARHEGIRISVDTSKPEVARECLKNGAHIINDVSGLNHPEMIGVIRDAKAGAVIMHMRGTPQTMQQLTQYEDVVGEVKQYLVDRARIATEAGIEEVIIDPGFGFAKTAQQNFEMLRRTEEFCDTGYPVLIGVSRKSFLGTLPSSAKMEDRVQAGLAAVTIAALKGASILRVHDVRECKRTIEVVEAIQKA